MLGKALAVGTSALGFLGIWYVGKWVSGWRCGEIDVTPRYRSEEGNLAVPVVVSLQGN